MCFWTYERQSLEEREDLKNLYATLLRVCWFCEIKKGIRSWIKQKEINKLKKNIKSLNN
jgi:hypothetical protein